MHPKAIYLLWKQIQPSFEETPESFQASWHTALYLDQELSVCYKAVGLLLSKDSPIMFYLP